MKMSISPPEQHHFSARPDLTVISLAGDEVRDFLNDIVTAEIKTLKQDTARPACL